MAQNHEYCAQLENGLTREALQKLRRQARRRNAVDSALADLQARQQQQSLLGCSA